MDQLVCSKVDILDQQCFTPPDQGLYGVCLFLLEVTRKVIKKLVRSSRNLCGHQETCACLCQYIASNWKTL